MKRFLMRCANLLGRTGLYQFLRPGRLPVFMLHRVREFPDTGNPGDLPADVLRSYLDYLAKHDYRVISMEELRLVLDQRGRIPARCVMFTIDDGFYDHHDVAARIFDEFGFPLNFFVITGLLDEELWPWDDQIGYALHRTSVLQSVLTLPSGKTYSMDLEARGVRQTSREIRNALKTGSQASVYDWLRTEFYNTLGVEYPAAIPREYRPMSWDQARSLQARGHWVCPHTHSHRILSALPRDQKYREIMKSRIRVEEELGACPDVFAYPTGRLTDYDKTDIELLRQTGFKLAFNTVPDYVQQGTSLLELPRFSVPGDMPDFLQIVNGLEALKERLPDPISHPRNLLSNR